MTLGHLGSFENPTVVFLEPQIVVLPLDFMRGAA